MTTAASNKPPPSTKVRLEELDLDDRVSGSRSNDTLEDSSGSRLPEVTPGADPVDAEGCCDPRSLLPGLDGRGIRVPMKRKVSSSGFSSLGTSGGSGVDGGIDLQFGGYRFNERGRLQKRQEWKCGSQTGQRRTMHRRRSELTPTPPVIHRADIKHQRDAERNSPEPACVPGQWKPTAGFFRPQRAA